MDNVRDNAWFAALGLALGSLDLTRKRKDVHGSTMYIRKGRLDTL